MPGSCAWRGRTSLVSICMCQPACFWEPSADSRACLANPMIGAAGSHHLPLVPLHEATSASGTTFSSGFGTPRLSNMRKHTFSQGRPQKQQTSLQQPTRGTDHGNCAMYHGPHLKKKRVLQFLLGKNRGTVINKPSALTIALLNPGGSDSRQWSLAESHAGARPYCQHF